MAPLDGLLARRTWLTAALALALLLGVVVATDETTSTLAMRGARMAALAPLVAAISGLAVLAHARVRGELRAVEALGVSPWGAARGAAFATFVVSAAGVALLLTPLVDATSLFPVARSAVEWTVSATALSARAPGVTAWSDGHLVLDASQAVAKRILPPGGGAAALCLGPLAACIAPWVATPMGAATRALSVTSAGLLAIVCLHVVAATRGSSLGGALAALPLLAAILWARRA